MKQANQINRKYTGILSLWVLLVLICSMAITVYTSDSNPNPTSEIRPNTVSDKWYYTENFDDKHIKDNQVMDSNNHAVWIINKTNGQKNNISDTGALELGGAQYMQHAVLADDKWGFKQNYAMEFTVNVQEMGNEGNSDRPIIAVIPRTKDKDFNEYYAVTYFMENTEGNMYRFKWAIINTAAPTKMNPLVEGYYLLKENIDYTARLAIENTGNEGVHIRFYIDSPAKPAETFKPLLEYTDSTPYKITTSVKGPAFGTVGYGGAGWGTAPIVRYDNIKLYDPAVFHSYEQQLAQYYLMKPTDIQSDKAYGEIRYLLNRGVGDLYPDGTYRPGEPVSVAAFIKMLINLKGEVLSTGYEDWAESYIHRGIEIGLIRPNEFSDYSKPITKYEAALFINRLNGRINVDEEYASLINTLLIKDMTDTPYKYRNAVRYTFAQGYLRLNDQFEFSGDSTVSRSECASILVRILDAGIRKINYDLQLPDILSSGAILQRNKKIPVWGRGICGETVTVKFKNQTKTTTVKDGRWYLELDPESQGGPYTLTVSSSFKSIVLKNIMVGEVFIVAGQSNSEMTLAECNEGIETRNRLKGKSNLRFYWGEKCTAVTPRFNSAGKWMPTADYVLDCSPAVGTFFVQKLLDINPALKDVPIGIIRLSYGGTTIEAFMPDAITKGKNDVLKDDQPIMSGFWNGFMDAVSPYAVKGVIYYQGENSVHLRYKYEPLLRDYLRGLRIEFKDANLPIMLVQLSGYGSNSLETDNDGWPYIREVQMRVANTTDNVGLVTAVDLQDPDPGQIHPKEKKKIGERLASLAMKMMYGQDTQCNSPQINSYRIENGKVTIAFDNVYDAIDFQDDTPKGFEVLDDQGKWHPAQAKVNSDNTVEIWSDAIPSPQGARYAWHNHPDISLFSTAGLPVLPFNTTK